MKLSILSAAIFALSLVLFSVNANAAVSGDRWIEIATATDIIALPSNNNSIEAVDETLRSRPASLKHPLDNVMLAEVSDNTDQSDPVDDFSMDEFDDDGTDDEYDLKLIPDPIEPFNRAMFAFNDWLYFWVLRPAAKDYNYVVPEKGRVGIKRFFLNLRTPIRLVNSLAQFKGHDAYTELYRFVVNTTYGVLGFMDPAKDKFHVSLHREDTGQTLGFYKLGPGFYIVWPILGPSSLRDTVGMVGDSFLNPTTYFFAHTDYEATTILIEGFRLFNGISLNLGLYEDIKRDSLDPYVFIRDAYHQHREHLITE